MNEVYYMLNKETGEVTSTSDIKEWGKSLETSKILKQDKIEDVKLSTVFLGVDHGGWYSGQPVLFETMIFGGENDMYCRRYSDMQSALLEHEIILCTMQNCYKLDLKF